MGTIRGSHVLEDPDKRQNQIRTTYYFDEDLEAGSVMTIRFVLRMWLLSFPVSYTGEDTAKSGRRPSPILMLF
jgi:hypothetical protein